ncbi:hypothetical protein [uncultured Helicobacter sp.]|uniref:hypothetical protein n=1 Tax=uncultured Helicobacter sp. TaxID=175537 RepID=UPI003751177D
MLPKVIDTIARLENDKILDKQDIRKIIDIYTKACDNEKIKAEFKNENILEKLHKKIQTLKQ